MLRLIMIPLVAVILIANVSVLSQTVERLDNNFQEDLHAVTCAREEVFQRNVSDAYRYLASLYPYVLERDFDISLYQSQTEASCGDEGSMASIYREVNSDLPSIYPNWIYRELVGGLKQ